MAERLTLLVVSDVHYASAAEKARGQTELAVIQRPLVRVLVRTFRHYLWMRHPHEHNELLERFLAEAGSPDFVVGNGDYACDSAFVGVSDEVTRQGTRECLDRFRVRFGERFQPGFGDHELGKMSLVGGRGGMRLTSWQRAQGELGLKPFWQVELGNYCLMGLVSSLVALPVYEPEALPEERARWQELRRDHLAEIHQAFRRLRPEQRVLLFCHDPTALPFLWREEPVRARLNQVEQTIIGHLHSEVFLWKSRLLAGMPVIRFLGNSVRRMSTALNEARHWRAFKVRLCPSLAGIQLLKDGGYYRVHLDTHGREPAEYVRHRLPWTVPSRGE